MNNDKVLNRNTSMDFVRCFACFGVVSVHFLLNNGFYETVVNCKRMYFMVFFRQFFLYCVPLFIMLSGYFECNKKPEAKYYKKIIRIIFIYVVLSVFCYFAKPYLYNCFKGKYELPDMDFGVLSFKGLIKGILGFNACTYAWYVEMYLGLFLLIPFINIMYNNIPSRKGKKILIVTLFLICSIPGIINVYNFEHIGFWLHPSAVDANGAYYEQVKIMPSWWMGVWPVLYYVLGCYVREFKISMGKI